MLRLILIIVPLAVTIYGLIDAIMTPRDQVRNLPKWLWILLIVVLWVGGAIVWLFLGRPLRGKRSGRTDPGGTYRRDNRPMGPDDDPNFIADLNRNKRLDRNKKKDKPTTD